MASRGPRRRVGLAKVSRTYRSNAPERSRMSSSSNRLRVQVLAVALALIHARAGQGNEKLYGKVALSTAVVYKSGSPYGSGTGFLIDEKERLLLTARHVLEKPGGGLVDSASVIFAQTKDGEIITDVAHYRKNWQALALSGKVVYENVRRDMAIVQLDKLPSGVRAL